MYVYVYFIEKKVYIYIIIYFKNYTSILFAQHVYVPDTQQFYKVTKKLLK